MKRSNTIGIVGRITAQPELVLDAADWARKVYETTLTRTRPSGAKDTYILQFDGRAAGSEGMFGKIKEGAEVLVGGAIRSENAREPKPEENRVKVYIRAELIAVNDPPVDDQNEVTICGNVCKKPYIRETRRKTAGGKRVTAANIIVAVNAQAGVDYIPCVCWDWEAYRASTLKVGDYVEIYGRFQSREFKKRIEGKKQPFLSTAYEVSAVRLKTGGEETDGKETDNKETEKRKDVEE